MNEIRNAFAKESEINNELNQSIDLLNASNTKLSLENDRLLRKNKDYKS
jgi:hypothetical protein